MSSFKDATAMADAVKTKKVSSYELVKNTIEKIDKLNPRLNAVVSRRFEEALKEAKDYKYLDKPFGGVPVLLKDLGQAQVNQPDTAGARLFKNHIASETDNYVKRLEELGFIVLGRTNTPEFGFKNISDSSLHGAVNLPNDLSRNAGGSSGGAAAAVASGMVPIAAASDGGGSIRIPAAFNGLIGLKPSKGRILVGPSNFRGWQGASVQFALTKSVRDTRTLLYGLQAYQIENPFSLPKLEVEHFRKNKHLSIAVQLNSPIKTKVSEEAIVAVKIAAKFLANKGHEVTVIEEYPIDGVEAMQSYYLMNSVETAAMLDKFEKQTGKKLDIADVELMTWALYQAGQRVPAKVYSNILSKWDDYTYQMSLFHNQYDLILSPTTADVAPYHGELNLSNRLKEILTNIEEYEFKEQQDFIWQMFERSLALTPFTQQANLTGQPAISLPIYRRADGLALGVQLTANKGKENLLLQVAQDFEDNHLFI